MSYSIKISPESRLDLISSLDYYHSINKQLSKRFYHLFNSEIERIRNNPKAFPIKHKSIRACSMSSFPYIICYFIDEENKTINVIAVFNSYQNPVKWIIRNK